MINKVLIVFAILLALQFSQQASATILVEPYLGYTLAEYDNGSTEEDANGLVLGTRLGTEFTLLWVALDFMLTQQDVDGTDADATRLGLVAGVTAPMGIRAWLGYYFMDELEFEGGTELEGTGIKLGIGFRLIPLLHLNFEYLMSTYDESNGSSISDREMNGLIATLSVPLSF